MSGVLELFYNDTWRPTCINSGFDPLASLACSELGFTGDDFYRISSNSKIGFWIVSLNCVGNESRLYECLSGNIIYSELCPSYIYKPICRLFCKNFLFLLFYVSIIKSCISFIAKILSYCSFVVNLRLFGGDASSNGKLQLLHSNGDWFDVCFDPFGDSLGNIENSYYYYDDESDENYSGFAWSSYHSQIACNQLGYRRYLNATDTNQPAFYTFAELYCSNFDANLDQCNLLYINNIFKRDYPECDGAVYLECDDLIGELSGCT